MIHADNWLFLLLIKSICFFIVVLAVTVNMHWAASARMLFSVAAFSCVVTEYVGRHRGVGESHSIARSNLKLARQKHDLLFGVHLFWSREFALTLIPNWKHYFMTQWISIHWEPWTMIGGLTIVWKASLVQVEMRFLCETCFLSKRTI